MDERADAVVAGYEDLVDTLTLPDPGRPACPRRGDCRAGQGDRHRNLRFSRRGTRPTRSREQHPDQFIAACWTFAPEQVIGAEQQASLVDRRSPWSELLALLDWAWPRRWMSCRLSHLPDIVQVAPTRHMAATLP